MTGNLLFENTLKHLDKLFHFAGIYIKIEDRVSGSRLKYRFVYLLHSFAANYQMFSSMFWFINGLRNGEDFLDIAYTIPCLTISILAQFKGLFLIKHEEQAQKLIANLIKLNNQEKEREQILEKDDIVTSDAKFLNFVLKTSSISYVVLFIGFLISPLVIIAAKYFMTKKLELILPFFTIYGFDPLQTTIWPFMYIHQVWSEVAVTLNICSADYLFFTCCTYIRIQFRLLRYYLENIIPTDGDTNTKFIEDEAFKRKFNKLIKWHQDLIESANILEVIYSKPTLFNFFSSSMIICLSGFNVTIVHDAANRMTFLSFLFLSLVQIFFLCFFADLLMSSSEEIGDGVYKSKLYLAEAKIGKNMLMVLQRSQHPCKITAAGYADVNLKSFMRVLSTAWSYFALLQTMYAD